MGSRPVVLALAGAATIAFSGILVRLADEPPSTAAFYRCAYALPALAALTFWERSRFGPLNGRERTLSTPGSCWTSGLRPAWSPRCRSSCLASF